MEPGKERVLLVEDDTISRELVAAQLKKLGYDPVVAQSGEEGWEKFRSGTIRLVVTDWVMPGMDGLELCRRIRSERSSRYIYIVLLTALDRRTKYVEGMQAGADDFIMKPCTLEELRVRLHVADRILSLQSEAQQLSRLLPICPRCKRIHTEDDVWQQVEVYIMRRTDAQFSHGICPDCVERILKPQLQQYKQQKTARDQSRAS